VAVDRTRSGEKGMGVRGWGGGLVVTMVWAQNKKFVRGKRTPIGGIATQQGRNREFKGRGKMSTYWRERGSPPHKFQN